MIALLGGVVMAAALLGWSGGSPAAALTGNPFDASGGFTLVALGDASLDNVELEGSLAVNGDVTFVRGYPIIHTSGLTPTAYAVPQYAGSPVRVVTGGRYDVAASAGVSEVSSRDWVTSDQIGRVLLGDTSNVSINPRGSTGLWISALGTPSGTEPAIHVPDVVNQTSGTVSAPGAYATLVGDASVFSAWNACLANLPASNGDAVDVVLEPGSHAGARNLALSNGVPNVLTLTSDDLVGASYRIDLTGAAPASSTPLILNITQGTATGFRIPEFTAADGSSAAQPNPVAPYVVYNLVGWTSPATIDGAKISGSVFAPDVDLTLQPSSPLEGQVVARDLATAGGEIHTYLSQVSTTCEPAEPATTTMTVAPTTAAATTTTTTTVAPTTTAATTTTVASTTTAATTTTVASTTTAVTTTTVASTTTAPTTTTVASTTTAPTTTTVASTTTAATTTTVAPTTTAVTTTTVLPNTTSTTAVAAGSRATATSVPGTPPVGGALPSAGSETTRSAAVALVLLAVGTGLVLATRRSAH